MKLALIRRQFSATGGAELYLQRLLIALAQAGHELHLFTEGWDQPPPGVAVHRVAAGGGRAWRPVRFAEGVRQALASHTFDCVFSLERTLQQDVYRAGDGVHRVWLQRRREFAPWWKKPFIGRGAFHRTMLALEAQTFNPTNTRHVIVNSEMVRREIVEQFRFPPERIHLVRNGVDVARFQNGRRTETRARFGVKDDECLLLFVGSGWERKGLKHVIEAVRRLPAHPPVKLLVVGKGSPPGGLPANVIVAGPMQDAENAFAAADLLVTLPIYEPSANVVFEALASGLPVVTSAFNGAAECLQEAVTGSVVADPADIPGVVRALEHWIARGTRRLSMDTGLFSLARNVAETVAILELAAGERRE